MENNGIVIRRERPEDYRTVEHLIRESFGSWSARAGRCSWRRKDWNETFFCSQTLYGQGLTRNLSRKEHEKMKKRLLVCAVLLLCAGLLLSGCAGVAETPEEAVLTPESGKSHLARIDEQEEAMKAFLLEHQTEMEELVAVMMESSVRSGENAFTIFEYNVIYHKLYQTRRIIRSVTSTVDHREGPLEEHPILAKLGFLDGEVPIQFVVTDLNHRIVDNDICYFSRYLHDDDGAGFCEVYLFYCEDEPVEKE